MSDRPVLLCYDGSEDAKHAIATAGEVLDSRPALVVTVWQDFAALPPFAWAAPMGGVEDFASAAREDARRVAAEGVELAKAAGFDASPLALESPTSVWGAVVEAAEERDVALIVLGSRGLGGIKSILLGSVSNGVVHHSRRPTLVVPREGD